VRISLLYNAGAGEGVSGRDLVEQIEADV